MKKYAVLLSFLGGFFPHEGYGLDLVQFFNELGSNAKLNAPAAAQDQSGGYYTGGSFHTRNGVQSVSPVNIQLPSVKAGCNGIDLYGGSFSFINSNQLVDTIKKISSSAVSYGLLIALETTSPQIYNAVVSLQNMANQVNAMNINTCSMAESLVGALAPKVDQVSEAYCKTAGTEGYFSDYAAARHGCLDRAKRNDVLAAKKPKEMLLDHYNLVFEALKQTSLGADWMNMAITLTGTLILRKEHPSAPSKILHYPSRALDESSFKALYEGGALQGYRCTDSETCLTLSSQNHEIPPEKSMLNRVRNILSQLVSKIQNDQPLDAQEKDFLESTRLPVYKMLNVSCAYRTGSAPIDLQTYAEVIAVDLLQSYIHQIMDQVQLNVQSLKKFAMNPDDIDTFMDNLRYVTNRLNQRFQSHFQRLTHIMDLVQQTEMIEKQVFSSFNRVGDE